MICKMCALDADRQSAGDHELGLVGVGHAACDGCDCQHYPVKEGQIKNG